MPSTAMGRKVRRVVVVLLFANALAGCQRESFVRSPDGPIVEDYFAGEFYLDPPPSSLPSAERVFEIAGPSSGPSRSLVLSNLSCGCATCDFLDTSVDPGGVARVKLGFALRYQRGRRTEGAVISFDGDEEASRVLRLTADVFPRIFVDPYTLGTVELRSGETSRKSVKVLSYAPRGEKDESLEVKVDCPGVSIVELGDVSSMTQGETLRLSRELLLEFHNGESARQVQGEGPTTADPFLVEGSIRISHGSRLLDRPVVWRHVPFIEFSPRNPFINAKNGGDGSHAEICLTSAEPFAITSLACADRNVVATAKATEPAKVQFVEISVESNSIESTAVKTIVAVGVDHPQQKVLHVPLNVLW